MQADVASDPAATVRDDNGIITRVSEANVCQGKNVIGFAVEFSAVLEPLETARRDVVNDVKE